jgi:hypothetical protein
MKGANASADALALSVASAVVDASEVPKVCCPDNPTRLTPEPTLPRAATRCSGKPPACSGSSSATHNPTPASRSADWRRGTTPRPLLAAFLLTTPTDRSTISRSKGRTIVHHYHR